MSELRATDVRRLPPPSRPEEESMGDLVGRMTSDLSDLFRQEVELAKVEITEEVTKTAKAAGMFGGTAFTGYMAVLLLSLAAAWGLTALIPTGFAFLAVGGLYAVIALITFLTGRSQASRIHGPTATTETIKEDAAWARERMS